MVSNTLLAVLATGLAGLLQPVSAAVDLTKRPDIKPGPLQPYKAFIESAPRTKTCRVKPSCTKGRDDSKTILEAFQDCNNGGTVVLDKEYEVCTALDLTFLKHVDVALTGTIKFCADLEYWTESSFQIDYQNSSSFWIWGGEDVNIFGHGRGTIDGNGQPWYDQFAVDSLAPRPILFTTLGLKGGSITGLKLRGSPNWHNLIAHSDDIFISDIDIYSRSNNKNQAKNLDGWDTYYADNIVIQNSHIEHDDDCVSFKPQSTNVIIQGLICNNSHGISVGSLGQYPDRFDIVENIYVYNVSLSNATDGARLKVWPGADTEWEGGIGGGNGAGYVRNVTYDTFHNVNNDAAIKIDQCYGEKNATRCATYPSRMNITDVLFKNFWGTTSKKNDPTVGDLICSAPGTCSNVRAENISITPPSGKAARWKCRYLAEGLLDLGGEGCIAG